MGTMANAKVAIIPITGGRVDPKLVETMMASTPEKSAPAKISRGRGCEAGHLDRAGAAGARDRRYAFLAMSPALRDVTRALLKQITRERIIALILACVSIGALFLVWYLGTKYKIEFYIRFKNVPTPYEVMQQAIQVGLVDEVPRQHRLQRQAHPARFRDRHC